MKIKNKQKLLEIYRNQPHDVDTRAVASKLRVQREWHNEKFGNVIGNLDLSNKKVLDLGCGSGGITRKLKNEFPTSGIFGVDFNANAISYARSKDRKTKGLKYKIGDAESIPFKDNYFDAVIGLDILDHVPDYRKCLSEIHRVLKQNGDLALTVENHRSLWPMVEFLWDRFGDSRDYGHVHVVHFTPQSFKKEVRKSGFEINSYYTIHNLNTFFYLITDFYPKSLNSFISRNRLGLTLFCHAKKK